MTKYYALGLMSGSSLDGLDMAYCEFQKSDDNWTYEIIVAETISYTEEWILTLKELPTATATKVLETNTSYGKLLADQINTFVKKHNIKPDIIASHGHTIFHEPASGFTFQLGDGQSIALNTGIKTISDFRSKDILLGGQGAPLVPIGDELLFHKFDFCLNIGGIANISFIKNSKRVAFDICGANQILNHLSLQLGKPYDDKGNIALLGKMNPKLFEKLNKDVYFLKSYPKSLSNQYVKNYFIKIVDNFNCSIEDKLYTVTKHIAYQINEAIKDFPAARLLITGGGAHNDFFVKAIKMETKHQLIKPDNITIDFKEALIFAFMGVLRVLGETNCLASVTGAIKDSSSGIVYYP
ncbi:MAG: anhydro-N-acetylmuramic acid kinase [Marinilabiliales bacterium]|nr:MAG: anhydro-N-acetylmuramic acid kinase [Marinilabiliales bacterium]